jgi:hypothetical protein
LASHARQDFLSAAYRVSPGFTGFSSIRESFPVFPIPPFQQFGFGTFFFSENEKRRRHERHRRFVDDG